MLASLLLAALLFRAYVPAGFMPAAGTPFLLELCPDAMPMPMPMPMPMVMPMPMAMVMQDGHRQHQHHPQDHSHFQNCPFGSAPAPGPVSQLIVFPPLERITSVVVPFVIPIRLTVRSPRAHQPRGPPSVV